MSYKIAIASTDGVNIDKHFGSTNSFIIININDDGSYERLEERAVEENQNNQKSCCGGSSCGSHSESNIQKKIDTIIDCRAVLCSKCGHGSEKQLGENNITTFQINLTIDKALNSVINYYKKIYRNK
jgi:predicted Fe-Mo cluster-binding NifX family protein